MNSQKEFLPGLAEPESAEPGSAEPGSAEPGSAEPGSAEPQLGPGTAEPQLGGLSPHLGAYSRGYLPHRDFPGILQFITYRLADSLPKDVAEQLTAASQHLSSKRREATLRKWIDDQLDAGLGTCILRIPEVAACIVDTWRRFAGDRYDLIAWVVMPNHVHVLIRVYEGAPLAKIVQSWKSYTGRRIGELMEEDDRRAGARRSQEPSWGSALPGPALPGPALPGPALPGPALPGSALPGTRRSRGVWMRDYWDRYIRDEKHFAAVVAYIHRNPVKAGLVERGRVAME